MTAVELFLRYEFLQLALVAACLMGVLAGALGVPLILREMAMFGHGFAHISYAGVALGVYAGVFPLGVALAVTVAGALAIEHLRSQDLLSGDTALAMVVSVGFAIGVVVVSLAGGFTTDLHSYLFGSLFAVSTRDLSLMIPLAGVLLGLFALLYKEIFYLAFDETGARLSGLPVAWLNGSMMVLTAATIVLASRIVGLLLVAALLVIPAATALQVSKRFRTAILGAMVTGLVSAVVGLAAAVQFDVASGGAIVLTAAALFGLVSIAQRAGRSQAT